MNSGVNGKIPWKGLVHELLWKQAKLLEMLSCAYMNLIPKYSDTVIPYYTNLKILNKPIRLPSHGSNKCLMNAEQCRIKLKELNCLLKHACTNIYTCS